MAHLEALGIIHIILIGFLALVFCGAIFFYGYRKRIHVPLPSINPQCIMSAQTIRFFSSVILISLLLAALSLGFSGLFVAKKTGVVAYLFDESRSQGAEDNIGISRIERAKQIALELDNFPHSTVAVYGFTDRAFSHSSFSDRHDYFENTVQYLVAIEAVPGAGTDMGFSLLNVIEDVIKERKTSKKKSAIIVLLSDGENMGEEEVLGYALSIAERNNIKIVAVGVGGDRPVSIPIYEDGALVGHEKDERGNDFMTNLDSATLQLIAEGSSGIYVRESNITEAQKFIGGELPDEKIKLKGVYNPLATYLLLAAIVPFIILKRYSKP